MKCIFEVYKSCYYRPDKEYASFKINIEKMKIEQRNLRLNALMNDKKCRCKECNPYTGN